MKGLFSLIINQHSYSFCQAHPPHIHVEELIVRALPGSYLFSSESLSSIAASIFLGQIYPKPEITSRPLGKAQNLFLSLWLTSALSLLYKLHCFDR